MLFLPLLANFFLIFGRKDRNDRGTLGKEVPIHEKDKNIFLVGFQEQKNSFKLTDGQKLQILINNFNVTDSPRIYVILAERLTKYFCLYRGRCN